MKLFWLPRKAKIRPLWTFTVQGVIWRLVPAGNAKLIGETRNLEGRSTTFFCLDQSSGKAAWKDMAFGEKWWIGIECVSGGVLFLHMFATPDLPRHRGMVAVDVELGRILWSSKDLTFLSVQAGSVFARSTNERGEQSVEIDTHSGKIVRQLEPHEFTSTPMPGPAPEEIHYTVPFDRGGTSRAEEAFHLWPRGMRAAGPFEFIEGYPFVVASFLEHTGKSVGDEGTLTNVVAVVEAASGKEAYSDILRADARASAPEQVFVRSGSLYYIREGCSIVCVPLPGWEAA